jgi:formiminotetrahydrofolate cyclodeaminase
VAAYLANGALEGGMLNVHVNLLAIQDQSFRGRIEWAMGQIVRRRDRLMDKILKLIRKI